MTIQIQDSNDLLRFVLSQPAAENCLLKYIIEQAEAEKNWFGYKQQKITAIVLAHAIAKEHANVMEPEEAVEYAMALNQAIYNKIIVPRRD